MSQNIILGEGVFSINDVDIAVTRGGGQFVVERAFKHIDADGDMGNVKGRNRKIRSVPMLTVNALELLPANLPKMYAATQITTVAGSPAKDTLTGKADVEDSDYVTVKFTGKNKGGRSVIITLENAINLEGIDWSLEDKDEVVATVTYTGHYLETAKDIEPWKIEFVDPV